MEIIFIFLFLIVLGFPIWVLFELYSIVGSLILCFLSILVTNFSFPFWKIYQPETGVSFGFTVMFLIIPITVINMVAISKIFVNIYNKKRSRSKFLFALSVLIFGFLCFEIGVLHNLYQSDPKRSLTLYLKQREHIVNLIKSGALHGNRNCLQNIQIYENEDYCQEEITLPEGYQGLSRGGKLDLIKRRQQLKILFIHHTYGFGDGRICITYSSSDNGTSLPRWNVERC